MLLKKFLQRQHKFDIGSTDRIFLIQVSFFTCACKLTAAEESNS